jgi:hypothetical protein
MGLREVFRLVLARTQSLTSAAALARPDARAWRSLAVVGAVLVLALGGTALLLFREPAAPLEAAGVATVCNGSARLCNRRLTSRSPARTIPCRTPRSRAGCFRTKTI